jgi:hypothetical protein
MDRSTSAARARLTKCLLAVTTAVALGGCVGGVPPPASNNATDTDAIDGGGQLVSTEHVSAHGSYQTNFEVPVPMAPAAPRLTLSYDSAASVTLAGVGWDLAVGWPMSISRDVRFGTLQWKHDSPWLLGTSPLVPTNVAQCALSGICLFRVAPDSLTVVEINTGASQPVTARVLMPDGTTLDYEPVQYDGSTNPTAPVGAHNFVMSFRLTSVVDRNGYRTCFRYEDFLDATAGRVGVLKEIGYGLSRAPTCAAVFTSLGRHRIEFQYDGMRASGFFASWTVRFGAPMSFDSLLKRITVFAAGTKQDEFALVHEGVASETRLPRLIRIEHTRTDIDSTAHTRVERAYRYGDRRPQFDGGTVVELGPEGSFPSSIAGMVSRPMRRMAIFENPLGIGQLGQDVATDVAPVTHATSEQWALTDINGDGLPDFHWSTETGANRALPKWRTFETAGLPGVQFSERPAQQSLSVNDGIAGGALATSLFMIDSHAPSLESTYRQGMPDPDAAPVSPQVDGFSPWFWGDGNGMTRTGMPVSVTAAEVANVAPTCPLDLGQDSRLWPRYLDGSDVGVPGSFTGSLAQITLIPGGVNKYFGNPVLGIITGIKNGFHPTYSVSSGLSAWLDLNGDGVQEFVATPGWIERFSIEPGCRRFTPSGLLSLRQYGARRVFPAATGRRATGYTTDTEWHSSDLPTLQPGVDNVLTLTRRPGPPSLTGMPLNYDISTSASESFGITIPIGGAVNAGISAALGGGWMAIAAAAPGLTIDTFTPRTAPGYTLSMPTPSPTAVLQAAGNVASSNASASSIAGFIMSIVRINFDLTLLSATNENRTETRGQLMDVNADGLADYLLYNSAPQAAGTALAGIPPGSLVAFLNSPSGVFSAPLVLNSGFDYVTAPPAVAPLESALADLRLLVEPFSNPLLAPNQLCYAGSISCAPFSGILAGVVAKANDIINSVAPFFAASADTTARERDLLTEARALKDTIEGMAVALPLWQPPSPATLTPLVDSTVAATESLVKNLGYLVRAVRHIGHTSKINVVSEGFSSLAGAWIGDAANGISAQTRGFVDLNGDALPDYVSLDVLPISGPCSGDPAAARASHRAPFCLRRRASTFRLRRATLARRVIRPCRST